MKTENGFSNQTREQEPPHHLHTKGCTCEGMLARAAIYEALAFDLELPEHDRAKAERLAEALRITARQMRDFLTEPGAGGETIVNPRMCRLYIQAIQETMSEKS